MLETLNILPGNVSAYLLQCGVFDMISGFMCMRLTMRHIGYINRKFMKLMFIVNRCGSVFFYSFLTIHLRLIISLFLDDCFYTLHVRPWSVPWSVPDILFVKVNVGSCRLRYVMIHFGSFFKSQFDIVI